MNKKYLIAVMLLSLAGNASFAQNKKPVKKEKAATVKQHKPPPPPKELVPVLEPAPTNYDDPQLAYPSVYIAPVAEIRDRKEAQARSRKKHYSRPFVYWPTADTVIKEDYDVYLAKKNAALKNYSTGNFSDKKKPVIKSTTELYYKLENDFKDTVRYYGDGWNQHSEFDQHGNRTKLYVIFLNEATGKDSMYLTTKYFYVGEKHAKTEHYWYASGRKEAEEEFEYDASGRMLKEYYTALDENGKDIVEAGRGSRVQYIYENGKTEKQQFERPEDYEDFYVLDKYTEITLNSAGNSKKEVTYDYQSEQVYQTWQFEYDERGNKVKDISSRGYTKTYSYDKFNNVTEEVTRPEGISDEKEITHTTYQYDRHGNWISSLSISSCEKGMKKTAGSTPYLCKRVITYYQD